ncbi:MAG TPA: NADH-quinone oxidoreductase subunit M [Pirellulales bacterium]
MNELAATVLLPLVGVGLIWAVGESSRNVARWIALITSLVTLLAAGRLLFAYPDVTPFDRMWINSPGVQVHFSLALDGLSAWLFGLSALLTLTSVLASWEAIKDRAPLFYSLLLLLETAMLGVFAARDIIVFYVFFEFTLIPLFFLIGVWGHEDRRYAAIKFFLFTLTGSVLTFLGLLSIVLWNFYHAMPGVLDFSFAAVKAGLAAQPIDPVLQLVIFLALFAGFAVKVPLFPLHTWLPLAHTQAPTAGSVLLAGILLKVGAYGFLRFSIPYLPDATATCMPWLLGLSVAGIIYGALVALAQSDMKRLIAYSSVSHLGFCMLGLFSLNRLGVQGGVLQMINHGLSTGGLFAIVGMIYDRYHTREISAFSGIAKRTPLLAVFMLIFTLSSVGLPGLNGFSGEFLLLLGAFQRGWTDAPQAWSIAMRVFSVLSVSGVILGAWYMLWLVQRVFFGPLKEPEQAGAHEPVADLNFREVCSVAPLVVFVFWIGLAPHHFLKPMAEDLDLIADEISAKVEQRFAPADPARAILAARAAELGASHAD